MIDDNTPMTTREQMATAMMAAIISSDRDYLLQNRAHIAQDAVALADALIWALGDNREG